MGLGTLLAGALIGAAAYDVLSDSPETSTDYQEEKIEFFDAYRALDNYLGRLVGQGSGGIGLLIGAYSYIGIDNYELGTYIEDLREIRGYRNNLAHNKGQWENLPDPDSYYVDVIDKVYDIVSKDEYEITRALYKELEYKRGY